MATQEALRNANSARPGALAKPVPGADSADALLAELDSADKLLAELDAPAASDQNGANQGFQGQMQQVNQPTPVEGATPDMPLDQFAQEPSFAEANLAQFNPKNFIDRLQAGLAANDTEKANFLRGKYGEKNVSVRDGVIYYRRDPSEKLKKLDPAAFELLSDIIPDFAREAITEAAMLPGELLGGAGGFIAGGGVGSLPGAAAGATVGRAASVPGANLLADKVAEAAGVPRDENRSRMGENLTGASLELAFPVLGKYIVKPVAGQIAKRIPGTIAYDTAKKKGAQEIVALSEQSREVLKMADDLEKSGILQKIDGAAVGVPGANVSLMLHQIQPDSPDVARLMKNMTELPQFLNAQMKQSEAYGAALENNLREIATRGGYGPVAPEKLGSVIVDAVSTLDRTEGRAIGKYRAKAMAALGMKKQQLPAEVSQEMVQIMNELGFNRQSKKLVTMTRPTFDKLGGRKVTERLDFVPPRDMQKIVGRLGLDEGQARSVVNVLNEYGQLVTRGNEARLPDVERMISRMGPLNKKLQGTALAGQWGKLTGQLREHRRAIIGSGLDDDFEKAAFNKSMDDFKMIRENVDQLENVLRSDVSAKNIVAGFFKGKENIANIRALKSLTGNDSPQWGALKEEFVNQLLLKHSGSGPTGFNSKAMLADLQKNYGDDFMREVFDDGKAGPNYDTVKKLLTVGQRIESTFRGVKADQVDDKVKQGLINTAIGLFADIKFKTVNGIASLIGARGNKENSLMEIMSRDGIEKYVANYPGKLSKSDRSRVVQNLKDMLGQYKVVRQLGQRAEAAAEVGKRGVKAGLRSDVMYGNAPAMDNYQEEEQ